MGNSILFSCLIYFFTNISSACLVAGEKEVNFFVDRNNKQLLTYSSNTTNLKQEEPVLVTNCEKESRQNKFLLLTYGPQVVDYSDQMVLGSFNKSLYVDNKCSLTNNPLENIFNFDKYNELYLKKWKFVEECLELKVEDSSRLGIAFGKQIGCNVEKINNSTAIFSGGFCFFKLKSDSSFKINTRIKASCLSDFKQYTDLPRDFLNVLNVFVSGNDSGESEDLQYLSKIDHRISINNSLSNSSIIRPEFSPKFFLEDVHFADIKFDSNSNREVNVSLSLVVDSSCESSGNQICNYLQPLFGKLDILLDNVKIKTISTGAILFPQWQGLVQLPSFKLNRSDLIKGKRLKLNYSISDPFNDFSIAKSSLANLSISRIPDISFNRSGDLSMPSLPSLDDLGKLPNLPMLPEIGFPLRHVQFESILEHMKIFALNSFWPIRYTEICNSKKCQILSSKNAIELSLSMDLDNELNPREIFTERRSNFLQNIPLKKFNNVNLKCEGFEN